MAMAFDIDRLETSGGPVPIVEDVFRSPNPILTTATANYGFSRGGMLTYVPETFAPDPQRTLVWVNRQGQEEPIAADPRPYFEVQLSPDARNVVVDVRESDDSDLWIYDLVRDTSTRLTFDPARDIWPLWTPGGERVVFSSTRGGENPNLYWKAANGIGPVERLTTSESVQAAHSFAPDGRLVFGDDRIDRLVDLHVMSMDGERSTDVLVQTDFRDAKADVSPDGRWMAHVSDESGISNVYVRPFPNVDDGRWQISRNGGYMPQWAPDSRGLFYLTPITDGRVEMMAVANDTEPTFRPGNPVPLFEGPYFAGTTAQHHVFDVSPDGQRFLMIKREATDETTSGEVILVQNWLEELKRLVPVD